MFRQFLKQLHLSPRNFFSPRTHSKNYTKLWETLNPTPTNKGKKEKVTYSNNTDAYRQHVLTNRSHQKFYQYNENCFVWYALWLGYVLMSKCQNNQNNKSVKQSKSKPISVPAVDTNQMFSPAVRLCNQTTDQIHSTHVMNASTHTGRQKNLLIIHELLERQLRNHP